MNSIKLFLILLLPLLGCNSTQESTPEDILRPDKNEIIGVWDIDLEEQKKNLDSDKLDELNKLDLEGKERFWEIVSSRVYAMNEEYGFALTWAENGALTIIEGTWEYNPKTGMLKLKSDTKLIEYEVRRNGVHQIWVPKTKDSKGFKVLYMRGVHLMNNP